MRSLFLILLSLASFASFANADVIRTYNAWLAEFNAEVATGPTDAQMRIWTFYHMPFADPTPVPNANPTSTPPSALTPTQDPMPKPGSGNSIFVSQNKTGSGSGLDAADALPVSYFNTSSSWTSAKPTGIQIGPGTTVNLVATISTALAIQGSGSAGRPITILFDSGANLTAANWDSGYALHGQNVAFIIVDGGSNGLITATNQNSASKLSSNGVDFEASHDIEIRNLTVTNMYVKQTQADPADNAGSCINFGAMGSNISVHNNTCHSAGACISSDRQTTTIANIAIYNNTLADANWCIQSGDDGAGSVCHGMLIHGNNITMPGSIWDDSNDDNHHNGIYIWAEHDTTVITGLKIYDNFIHGAAGAHSTAYIYISGNGTPGSAQYISRGLEGAMIYNNIIVTTDGGATNGCIFVSCDGFIVASNTLVGIGDGPLAGREYTGSTPGTTGTIENNLECGMSQDWYMVGGVTSLAMSSELYNVNPLFVNGSSDSAATNFELAGGSPATGAKNLSTLFATDFRGSARPATGSWSYGALAP